MQVGEMYLNGSACIFMDETTVSLDYLISKAWMPATKRIMLC